MNYGELKVEIIRHLSSRTDLESKIPYWLDEALRELQNRADWDCMYSVGTFDTVADQETYNLKSLLDANLKVLTHLEYDNNIKIVKRAMNEYLEEKLSTSSTNSTGSPAIYSYFGDTLYLYPVSDEIITITSYYTKYLLFGNSPNDNQTTLFTDKYPYLTIYQTCVVGATSINYAAEAKRFKGEAMERYFEARRHEVYSKERDKYRAIKFPASG